MSARLLDCFACVVIGSLVACGGGGGGDACHARAPGPRVSGFRGASIPIEVRELLARRMRREVGGYTSGDISVYEGTIAVRSGTMRFGGRALAQIERSSMRADLWIRPADGVAWDEEIEVERPLISLQQTVPGTSTFEVSFMRIGPDSGIGLGAQCEGCVTPFLDASPSRIHIDADLATTSLRARAEGVLFQLPASQITTEQIVAMAHVTGQHIEAEEITWPLQGNPITELALERGERVNSECTSVYTAEAFISRGCPSSYGVRNVFVASEPCGQAR